MATIKVGELFDDFIKKVEEELHTRECLFHNFNNVAIGEPYQCICEDKPKEES